MSEFKSQYHQAPISNNGFPIVFLPGKGIPYERIEIEGIEVFSPLIKRNREKRNANEN